MGDRYFLTVTCPKCQRVEKDVYYAPTCDITHYQCLCGHIIDLGELTGISYEDASNFKEIEEFCERADKAVKKEACECVCCGFRGSFSDFTISEEVNSKSSCPKCGDTNSPIHLRPSQIVREIAKDVFDCC